MSERDPGALTDLLEVEVAALLEAFGEDGEQPVWYFTVQHTVAGVGAILLGKLLLHGWTRPAPAGGPGRLPGRRRWPAFGVSCPRSSWRSMRTPPRRFVSPPAST
ncbi:MAG: hypothetical protein ACR2FQ_02650 [Pseudonocardiaceae bacterium]